jgi:hypothetical protein
MNEPTDTDWKRLVRKTRRRPLMYDPIAVQTAEGTKVRPKWVRLVGVIGIGGFFAGLLFFMGASQPATLVPVGLVLWAAIHELCFPRRVFIPANADEVIVRYGFFLLPTRLVLNRQSVVVDFQVAAETELPRGWGGFKIVLLRHVETDQVAHLGYTMQRDDALRVFDTLSGLLAEGGRNFTEAVVTLHDGSLLRVDRLATWAAGHKRRYKSRLSVIADNAAEIERRAFSRDRAIVDRAADIYPVRIATNHETIRIVYSNGGEKSVSWDDCVALQLCKEEIAERATRYEVNLILDSFDDNRLNLMSFDVRRHESADEPRRAAEQLGELLDLEVLDHL